jgi:NAD-dependent SIR2 family protein deacetylase
MSRETSQRQGPLTPEKVVREPKPLESDGLGELAKAVQEGLLYARVPLFVIGAGVSAEVVPLLRDIGSWLHSKLDELQKERKIPFRYDWVLAHASAVSRNAATRRQAAELFSVLQSRVEPFKSIWETFSRNFLVGPLEIPQSRWEKGFVGLCNEGIKPTPAHREIAEMLRRNRAYAVSLNFDGLTRRALTMDNQAGLSLHTEAEVRNYFSAGTKEFFPAVFKVRGDVFFARCENELCPQHEGEYPLDHLLATQGAQDPLLCPACHVNSLRLQFSFPGYRAKEEAADPILWSLRRFVGDRISAIVVVGLSGRWDRYLLRFLFDFAQERRLVVADVKPPNAEEDFIENFRGLYYPSVRRSEGKSWNPDEAVYLRVLRYANPAIGQLRGALLD